MGNLIVNIACGSRSTIDTIFGQWFMRRRFFFCYIKQCPLGRGHLWPQGLQLNKITLPQGCSTPNINTFWPVVHEKKVFI